MSKCKAVLDSQKVTSLSVKRKPKNNEKSKGAAYDKKRK